jgi:tRNA1(Val) A37 N6-methylase TrmN6
MKMKINIYNEDYNWRKNIEDKSVDLIICDPPLIDETRFVNTIIVKKVLL